MSARLHILPLAPLSPERFGDHPLATTMQYTWHGVPLNARAVVPTEDDVTSAVVPRLETLLPAWHGPTPRRGKALAAVGSSTERLAVISSLIDGYGAPTAITASVRGLGAFGRAGLDKHRVAMPAALGHGARHACTTRVADPETAQGLLTSDAPIWLLFGLDEPEPFIAAMLASAIELSSWPDLLARCVARVVAGSREEVMRIDVADTTSDRLLHTLSSVTSRDATPPSQWKRVARSDASEVGDDALALMGHGSLSALVGEPVRQIELTSHPRNPWIDTSTLARLPRLDALAVNEGCVWSLSGLERLQSLRLPSPPLSGWEALSAFERLRSLDSGYATRALVDAIAGCPRLRDLEICETDDPEGILASIPQLRGLEALTLGFGVSDLTPIGRLSSLEGLSLLDPAKVPPDLAPLAKCTRLRRLRLPLQNGLRGLAPIAGLAIEELFLGEDDIDFEPLAHMTALRTLVLRGRPLPPGLYARLAAVETLVIEGVADLDLTPIAAMPRLRRLDLFDSTVRDPVPSLEGIEVENLEVTPR